MNKNDIFLVLIIIVIAFVSLFFLINKEEGTAVVAYYEDKKVLTVPLDVDNKYIINGYLGEVQIEIKNNRVRVLEENSPRHLCSNQGWISKSYESIICLPNKVIINIENNSELDAIVK